MNLGLEVRECYKVLQQISPNPFEVLQFNIMRHRSPEAWDFELRQIVDEYILPSQYRTQMIHYYDQCGVGIKRMERLLNTSQQTIYKIRKNPPIITTYKLFEEEPQAEDNLVYLMERLHVFHGFNPRNTGNAHSYLRGQIRYDE